MFYLLTFISGLIIELTAVGWVHFSERNKPFLTAIFGIVQATAMVFGIGGSIQNWRQALFFIFGYGIGSYLGVKIKQQIKC